MSLSHSPKIVTDGLVLAYDMGNTRKSWKGAPATNYIINQVWNGDAVGNVFTNIVTNPAHQFKGLPTSKLTNPSAGFNCYINGTNLNKTLSSTDWTFLCYIRRADKLPIPNLSTYLYSFSTDAAAASVTSVGDGWYRLYRTKSGTTSTVALVGIAGLIQNVEYYVSGATLTPTTYPVDMLLTNSTRTNTQSIVDIINDANTITANSLTYNADGSFSFNAAGNYISLPANIGYTTNVSAFAWMKTTGAARGGYHIIFGPSSLEISIPAATGEIRTGIDTADGRFVSNHGSGLTNGNWHYVGFTFDGTTKKSYIDGVLVGTQSVTGILSYNIATRSIGKFGQSDATYGMNGYISTVHIYKTALTQEDVKRNFNALRGRYGI